jgi:Flp pilus assembly protein TadD
VQQLRAVNEKTTVTTAATIARRAAIVPKLFEDYTPYIGLGKRAADEAEKRSVEPADGDDMIRLSYGAILLRAGKTDEAIVQLEKAAKLKPDRIWPMQFLTLAYTQCGDKATAHQWFDKSEAWIKTEMDKIFPGAENWSARLQVLLLWRECKQALGVK